MASPTTADIASSLCNEHGRVTLNTPMTTFGAFPREKCISIASQPRATLVGQQIDKKYTWSTWSRFTIDFALQPSAYLEILLPAPEPYIALIGVGNSAEAEGSTVIQQWLPTALRASPRKYAYNVELTPRNHYWPTTSHGISANKLLQATTIAGLDGLDSRRSLQADFVCQANHPEPLVYLAAKILRLSRGRC